VTDLHAQIDVIEGELSEPLVGGAAGLSRRTFAVLRLMRSDGTTGLGEASPLPGYSPDSISEVSEELQRLADEPVRANPLAGPSELLAQTFAAHPLKHPSSRLALETAMLDWLGHSQGKPVHQILAGDVAAQPIPIADLVVQAPAAWPARVDALLTDGATHLKLKVGSDLDAEVAALREIRRAHPTVPLRIGPPR
jgi:L-alanine-DL-glutamate epimerase-like enolase superfamily enzyme